MAVDTRTAARVRQETVGRRRRLMPRGLITLRERLRKRVEVPTDGPRPIAPEHRPTLTLHFRRLELKFLLEERRVEQFLERIRPFTEVDPYLGREGKGRTYYHVTSLYFDSPDLQSLYEKDAGLLSRRKLRLRTYAREFSETGSSFIEIKRKHDLLVSKDRLSISVAHLSSAVAMSALYRYLLRRVEASEEVAAEAHVLGAWYGLESTALVSYERWPFVARQDSDVRLTVDRHLQGFWKPPSLLGPVPLRPCNRGWSVVELKCNGLVPGWFHELTMDFQLERVAFSKYGTVVRVTYPAAVGE